jgi:lysophospholipase L1-like esterase
MWGVEKRQARGRGGIVAACVALACLCSLPPAGAAAAAEAAKVEVGKVRLGLPTNGGGALLVPVRYPIEFAGRGVTLDVALMHRGSGAIESRRLRVRPSSGPLRQPERRRGFTFVHRVDLAPPLARLARRGAEVRVRAGGRLDFNGDGLAELRSGDRETQTLRSGTGAGLCSSLPRLRVRPQGRAVVALPACASWVRWRLDARPEHGSSRIRDGKLIFKPGRKFRGTASIALRGRTLGAVASAAGEAPAAQLQVTVGSGGGAVVRALGDSVTAGFGYYDNGSSMEFASLLSCKPGATTYNDACSSNSTNTSNEGAVVNYSPDYGLANNVSWAAQWANSHGVTNYANYAISGSEPSDWAPGGQFYSTTKQIESENPDYLLMTIGANPLLSDMLFGTSNIGCAVESDVFGGFRECIEKAFAGVNLQANLKSLYTELVAKTNATIYLMGYPGTVPSSAIGYSATQLAMTGKLVNREIAAVAAEVSPSRLQPVLPPHFNVGVDISPVYPSRYTCSSFGFKVDGPSVQSEPTQDELEILHPLSFCDGPEEGPPWVIGGDTGIHPSAAGYGQMAARLPAPSAP